MNPVADLIPLTVEIDGPATLQVDEECIFILCRHGNRIVSVDRNLPNAAAVACAIACAVNKQYQEKSQ